MDVKRLRSFTINQRWEKSPCPLFTIIEWRNEVRLLTLNSVYVRHPSDQDFSDCVVGYIFLPIVSNIAKTALPTKLWSRQKMHDDLRFPFRPFSQTILSQFVEQKGYHEYFVASFQASPAQNNQVLLITPLII